MYKFSAANKIIRDELTGTTEKDIMFWGTRFRSHFCDNSLTLNLSLSKVIDHLSFLETIRISANAFPFHACQISTGISSCSPVREGKKGRGGKMDWASVRNEWWFIK